MSGYMRSFPICADQRKAAILEFYPELRNEVGLLDAAAKFPLAITPYYASIIKSLDGKDPVFQMAVPQVQELTWILSCLTPMGLLERCHSFKDKTARGIAANVGLFNYPVLMAADILLYKANGVPVGKDQKQHLEVTRDLAVRFNNQFGDVLTVPEPMIREEVAVIPGTDGQKMSKSYGNTIEIFGTEKEMRKKVMRVVTDSTPVEAPKDPEKCNVFALYKLMATPEELEKLRGMYLAGGMGYGTAKQMLFEKYWDYFRAARERREEILKNPGYVEQVLKDGAARAAEVAEATMREVRKAVGLR
jgi:tryptophanyl-tRNA synthetase